MHRDLPPFLAVRAFEAAARHLSFKKAAEELHVTQSAISHRVKALEQYLGRSLFRRQSGGVVLTAAGRSYLPTVGEVLYRLESGTRRIRGEGTFGNLAVTTTPAFAARWLVPRLDSFRMAHSDIDLHLTTTVRRVDFDRDAVDVAVWYGKNDWPGLRSDSILRSLLYPVCSPRLLEGTLPLRDADGLRRHTLLHADGGEAWARWLELAGVRGIDTTRGIRFDDCNLMIEAAIENQGIALVFSTLVAADLADGRLVRPFDLGLQPECWYFVLSPNEWSERPRIKAFRSWILNMAAQETELAAAE